MMITPSQILASARSLAATAGGTLDESIDTLTVSGQFDEPLLMQWRLIATEIAASSIGTITALDSLGDEVSLATAVLDELHGTIRVIVAKPNSLTNYFVYSCKGLASLLGSAEKIAPATSVHIAELTYSFSAESCEYIPWNGEHSELNSPQPNLTIPSPRRIVRDVAGGRVPISIGPFLLVRTPEVVSAPYEIWQLAACQQMLTCLVNEVWRSDGVEFITLSGPRTRKLPSDLDSITADGTFSVATDCARWVFANGRDIEVRHTLFTYELAREWPETETFSQGFPTKSARALDAAKTAFHAHIRETSKDTLKALSDLRKTLSEEITKVVLQTRELLSVMWRDFAFATTVLVARLALLVAEKPAAASPLVKGLTLGTAVFLAFSLFITLRSNQRFMAIAAESRKSWKDKLYGFLPADDLEKLADAPLCKSELEYNSAKHWVVGAYVSVITLLCVSVVWPVAPVNDRQPPLSQSNASSSPAVPATANSPVGATPSTKPITGASAAPASPPPLSNAKKSP